MDSFDELRKIFFYAKKAGSPYLERWISSHKKSIDNRTIELVVDINNSYNSQIERIIESTREKYITMDEVNEMHKKISKLYANLMNLNGRAADGRTADASKNIMNGMIADAALSVAAAADDGGGSDRSPNEPLDPGEKIRLENSNHYITILETLCGELYRCELGLVSKMVVVRIAVANTGHDILAHFSSSSMQKQITAEIPIEHPAIAGFFYRNDVAYTVDIWEDGQLLMELTSGTSDDETLLRAIYYCAMAFDRLNANGILHWQADAMRCITMDGNAWKIMDIGLAIENQHRLRVDAALFYYSIESQCNIRLPNEFMDKLKIDFPVHCPVDYSNDPSEIISSAYRLIKK